jgi:exosortase
MKTEKKTVISLSLLTVSIVLLYSPVIVKLVHDWMTDDNSSHGFIILPIALYFVWERRRKLADAEIKSSILGLILLLVSYIMLLFGIIGAELFISRVAIIGTLAGAIIYVYGWRYFKILLFPLMFLLLMIPIPNIILNKIAFPLQLLASQFSEFVLALCRIPVLREGNIIHLSNIELEVVEACSGIRSLISMLTLGIIYGYFTDKRMTVRFTLALSSIPIAIIANGFRVALTGVAAHYYGPVVAQGALHTFSGWLIFLLAFVMLLLLHHSIRGFAKSRRVLGCLQHK